MLWPDGSSLYPDEIIAGGHSSVLILHSSDTVLKVPHKTLVKGRDGSWMPDTVQDELNEAAYLNEFVAYIRLIGCRGIAEFRGSIADSLALKYYPAGSLENRLVSSECSMPPLGLRLRWMSDAVHSINSCHEARILLYDIALRNFVITEDLTLLAIDFEQASIFPEDTNLETAEDHLGVTVRVDMFHLGCVLFSLATWKKCHIECRSEEHWPLLESLPCVTGIPWGYLIWSCWVKRFRNCGELLRYCSKPRARRRRKMRERKQGIE